MFLKKVKYYLFCRSYCYEVIIVSKNEAIFLKQNRHRLQSWLLNSTLARGS